MTGQNVLYARSAPVNGEIRPLPRLEADFKISESNHRIANNLALLVSGIGIRTAEVKRRARDLAPEEVALILGELSARISTVAWLHRFLSSEPDAERVDINAHLYELGEMLISALADPGRMVLLRTGGGHCRVAQREVVPLSLIVAEAVTNSLKFAHPTGVKGTISVGSRELVNGDLVVEIVDDGVGLPEGFDFLADGHNGARTIRALARQLGARVEIVSLPIGLSFRLTLPRRPA
jgi:two-component sensor histidine kinase